MKCDFCRLGCDLEKGAVCGAYELRDGSIREKHPFSWTTCRTALCEDIPMFHFYPRRKLLEVGGLRCNAACGYCINARFVDKTGKEENLMPLDAGQLLHISEKLGCTGIHFGINEVTCNLISAMETVRMAKGVHPEYVAGACTNGYMTESAAEEMAEELDYLNISLKSDSSEFYQKRVGLPDADEVKENIRFFAKRLHVEVTTSVVQGENEEDLERIAEFLASIDSEIPLHVFRLLPEHRMRDAAPPDVRALEERILRLRKLLPYTYFSNFLGSMLDNTVCPECGSVVMRRLCVKPCGATLTDYSLTEEKRCPVCGSSIRLTGQPDRSITEGEAIA